jgi:hypothetical protein
MIIYSRQGRYYITDRGTSFSLKDNELDFIEVGSRVKFLFSRWPPDNSRSKLERDYAYADILDRDGVAYGTTFEQIHDGIHDGLDINVQDQTTDPVIQKFNMVTNSTTLNGAVAIEDRSIVVTDATGIVAGSHIILFDPASIRFTTFTAGTPTGTTIPLDGPLDFAYPDGTFVDIGVTNMAVNGSVTPQIFGLRGTGAPPGVDLTFDLTRIVITLLCTNAPAFDLFGDQTALTNGIVFRKRDGKFFNVFNVKTNGEWAGIMYDLSATDSVNPQQGQNGWIGRMTFASQGKIGVVIRLPIGEDAEFIIQDNLTDIESLEIVAEGHIVKP